jgi:hypothetical protein
VKLAAALLPLALLAAVPSEAATLMLDYSVATSPTGTYRYNFELRLVDEDGTWRSGQQWDWIVFGDRPGSGLPSGFCPTGLSCPTDAFVNFSSSDPTANLGFSGGGHQGPTIQYGSSVLLPGWQPTQVGDTLTWSGESSIFLGSGQLFWSTLVTGGGAQRVDFSVANLRAASAVPEPETWMMLILGFLGIGAALRSTKRKRSAAAYA